MDEELAKARNVFADTLNNHFDHKKGIKTTFVLIVDGPHGMESIDLFENGHHRFVAESLNKLRAVVEALQSI